MNIYESRRSGKQNILRTQKYYRFETKITFVLRKTKNPKLWMFVKQSSSLAFTWAPAHMIRLSSLLDYGTL